MARPTKWAVINWTEDKCDLKTWFWNFKNAFGTVLLFLQRVERTFSACLYHFFSLSVTRTVCRPSGRSWRCTSCSSARPARQTCWWTFPGWAGKPRIQNPSCARRDTDDALHRRNDRSQYAGKENSHSSVISVLLWSCEALTHRYNVLYGQDGDSGNTVTMTTTQHQWSLPGSTWSSSAWWPQAPAPPLSSHRSPLCWAARCTSPKKRRWQKPWKCKIKSGYKRRERCVHVLPEGWLGSSFSTCTASQRTPGPPPTSHSVHKRKLNK